MADIIPIEQARQKKQVQLEQLFQEFVDKQNKAHATLDLKDGLDAGQAWRRFLEAFE